MSNAVTSPDLVTIITNIAVFVAAAGTTIAAIWGAVKKIKTALPEQSSTASGVKALGATIMDNTTMLMWSESNRDVVDALRDHQKEMMELRFAVVQLKDAMK